jgi:hypothetical protein
MDYERRTRETTTSLGPQVSFFCHSMYIVLTNVPAFFLLFHSAFYLQTSDKQRMTSRQQMTEMDGWTANDERFVCSPYVIFIILLLIYLHFSFFYFPSTKK